MSGQFHFDWSLPPLDSEDQRLIDAYVSVGKFVDELPYSEEFEKIRRIIGAEENDETRRAIFRRLLRLRKTGRLPRLGRSVG